MLEPSLMDKIIRCRDYEGTAAELRPGDRIAWNAKFTLDWTDPVKGRGEVIFSLELELENRDGVLVARGPLKCVGMDFRPG
jgi:hypothetical protein